MHIGPATRPVKAAAQFCLLARLPRDCQINRKLKLIELPVSHSKQRRIPKINRQLLGTPRAYPVFLTPETLNPTPCPINRHTFLLEIAVSDRKQSPSQNLLATKAPLFPHFSKVLLATYSCPPIGTVFSSTPSASSASLASFASHPRHALNSPFRLNPRGQSCS